MFLYVDFLLICAKLNICGYVDNIWRSQTMRILKWKSL
jgi:hypothetical protein